MPYSRAKEKRLAKLVKWPDIRYNPATDEAKLFYEAGDVPPGWLKKLQKTKTPKTSVYYDKQELLDQLTSLGIEADPTWGTAHMKKVIDEVQQPEEGIV
jgi:hypothetical protein